MVNLFFGKRREINISQMLLDLFICVLIYPTKCKLIEATL
jgi:hypothetical protein